MSVLVSTTDVKQFLQITTTTYDTLIDAYIPIVVEDISDYCNQFFTQSWRIFSGPDFDFSSTALTITDSNDTTTDFAEELQTTDTIRVFNSQFNNEYFTVSAISANVLTVNESYINDESTSNNQITISRVEFPKPLQVIASEMIGHKIQNTDITFNKGVSNKRIGDFSISYSGNSGNYVNVGSNSYPQSIVSGLNKYRVVGKA
jgi:hypothetical protein